MPLETPALAAQPVTNTPIAIVGMACLFPQADGLTRYWGNIKRGVDAIGPVPASHWSPDDYFDADPKRPDHTYAQRGGFLTPVPFDPTAYGIAPHALEATDSAQVLGLIVAAEALKHAGYGPERPFDRSRVSVVLGVTGTLQLVIPLGARLGHPHWRRALQQAGVPVAQAEQVMQHLQDAYVPWQEASFPGLLGNVVAGRIANRLDLGGTNCVVDAACASSLSAVHLATLELASGRASMVVTGGVDAFNDIFMYMCFSKTPALSPTGHARPYDAQGDGTILGEGVGMLVLKRLADAERDGDEVLAVIKGVGTASDGRGKAIYAPDDDGQQRALQSAYAAAGVSPDTIELLEGHGTGTKVGDAIEVKALRRVFGDVAPGQQRCALGSVKSQIGHTKAAAGAAGLIKATLALYHKVLPPTCKIAQPLPLLEEPQSPFYLPATPRPWLPRATHPRRAAVSSFGFGGSNFHAVLEEYVPERRQVAWDGRIELVTLAAPSGQDVVAQLAAFEATASWDEIRVAAASARAAFSPTSRCRLTFVLEEGVTDRAALLERLRRHVTAETPFEWPDGVFFGVGPADGHLGALFPGQGSQYPGMGRDWACLFPAALNALQTMEQTLALHGGGERPHGARLVDRIYPPTDYRADAAARHDEMLRATEMAQPAIGALSLGMWACLQTWGLEPAAAAGHSYGELSALMAAGRLGVADFARLSVLRGRLMANTGADRGAMLAVVAPLAEVETWLAAHPLDVVVANRNAPNQVVLSGASSAIAQSEAALKQAGKRVVRLPVSAAFHSPLVADAERPLAEALSSVAFESGRFPVYSNTTGAVYPADPAAARQLLAHQLASPVNWVAQIEAMYAAGVRTFLEIGPGARLSGLVKAILGDRPHAAVALDASNGKRDGVLDLARALAQLASRGHTVSLTLWQGGEDALRPLKEKKKPKMVVMVSGAPYRSTAPRPVVPSAMPVAPSTGAAEPLTPPKPQGTPVVTHNSSDFTPTGAVSRDPAALQAAIQASLETVAAWQAAQHQAAQMHQAFLASQREAQENLRQLMEQQRRLLGELTGQGLEGAAASAPSPRPGAAAAPQASGGAAVASVRQKLRKMRSGSPSTSPTPAVEPGPSVAPAVPPAAAAPLTPLPVSPVPAPAAAAFIPVPAMVAPALGVDVAAALLAVVSDKTGYPPDTLELDMALEGDLGIDSIKRVEILSGLVERLPGTQPIGPEQAAGLHTLRDVVAAFGASAAPPVVAAPAPAIHAPATLAPAVVSPPVPVAPSVSPVPASPALAPAVSPSASAVPVAPSVSPVPAPFVAPAAAATAPGVDVAAALLAVVSEKTGYPPDTLELDMALEGDLGIDSIKRVEILSGLVERLPGAQPIGPEQAAGLHTLRDVIAAFGPAAAPAASPALSVPPPVAVAPAPAVHAPAVLAPAIFPSAPPAPVAPSVSPVPAPAVAPAAAVPSPGADVAAALLAVVSEKTGYPPDTLELDMALEGDLGIDSIKRVEILSGLVERLPGAQPIGPEQAAGLLTLRDVVAAFGPAPAPVAPVVPAFSAPAAQVHAPPAAVAPPPVAPPLAAPFVPAATELPSLPQAPAANTPAVSPVNPPSPSPAAPVAAEPVVDAAHAERERQAAGLWAQVRLAPDPAVSLNLQCEHPVMVRLPDAPRLTKPKLAHGAEVWVAGPPGSRLVVTLAECLQSAGIAASAIELAGEQLWQVPEALAGLLLVAPSGKGPDWSRADEETLRAAFHLVTQVGPRLRQQAATQGTWFATVARMDGAFGCADASQAFNPVAGALAGLAKTAQLEWPEVVVQAFDVHTAWDDAEVALALVEELGQPGPVEVGLGPEGRFGLTLEPAGPAPLRAAPLKPGELLVLTGGARGVTAEVAVALARAYKPVVALLGRTALPEAEPQWLAVAQDEASVKRAIAAQAVTPLAPKELEARWQDVAAAREVAQTLLRLREQGVEVAYHPVDVRDEAAVQRVFAQLRASYGPVRMLVHGAGVLADKYIVDKTMAMYDRVFDTKVAGLRALWKALAPNELRALVLFSSVTARVGRVGQSDYAMANEVLNKFARRLAATSLDTRVISVGWGPWDGGMVTPALKEMFRAEGVGVVPLDAGAVWLAAELGRERHPVPELVVTGMPVVGGDPLGGRPEGVPSPEATADPTARLGEAIAHHLDTRFKTVMSRELSIYTHPFLTDHVLSGKAVLPVAVMLEWLAAAARAAQPQLRFWGFDEFVLLKGVVLEGDRYSLRFDAGPAEPDPQGGVQVGVRLYGEGRDRPLAYATALLSETPPLGPRGHWSQGWRGGAEAWPYFRGLDEAYRNVLFHGPEFHALMAVEALGPEGVLGRVKASPRPGRWMQEPATETWLTEPLAIDALFQLLILWSVETLGAPCLPCRVANFRQYRPFLSSAYTVAVHVTARRVGTLLADAAFTDAAGELVAEFRGAECTFNAGLVDAFRRNTLASSAIS